MNAFASGESKRGWILPESIQYTHADEHNFYVRASIHECFVNVGCIASEFVDFKCAIEFIATATNAFFVLRALHSVGKKFNFIAVKNIGFIVWIFNTRAIVHGARGIAFAIVFSFSKACG